MQAASQPKKKGANLSPAQQVYIKNSFLGKLYSILNNKEVANIICWTDDGEKFQILNSDLFQNEVIPKYFKHRNLKSFVRQLNLHGFKKLRAKTKARETAHDLYKHNFFRRDQPDLIGFIKRKIAKPVETDEKVDQINSLIQKQKELQERVRQISEAKSSDVYKVLVQSSDDEPTKLFLSALKVFSELSCNPQANPDPQASTVFSLTKNFLSNLSSLGVEKSLSEMGTTTTSLLEGERDYSLLAKRNPHDWEDDEDDLDDSQEDEYEGLDSPPRKKVSGQNTPSVTESE